MLGRPEAGGGPTARAQQGGYLRLLRDRSITLLWVSQLVSQGGDYLFDVALIWFVVTSSRGSALDVALVSIAAFVPWVLFSPVIGALLDEGSRRSALLWSNLLQAGIVTLLAYFVLVRSFDLGPILVLVLLLNSAGVAVGVASRAILAQLVAKEDLAAANGLFFFSNSANQLLGFSLGGVVVAFAGTVLPIEYDALTFVVAAALVLSLPACDVLVLPSPVPPGAPAVVGALPPTIPDPPPAPARFGPLSVFWRDLLEGAHYVRKNPTLSRMLWMVAFSSFVLNGYTVLGVLYVHNVLQGGSSDYGFFLGSMAAGGTLGSLLVGRMDVRDHVGRLLFLGTGGLGAATLLLGFSPLLLLGLPLAFVLNASGSLVTVSTSSWIEAEVPPRLQARVWGYTGLTRAGAPVGAAVMGSLASELAVPTVFLAVGLFILLVVGITHTLFRDLRKVRY